MIASAIPVGQPKRTLFITSDDRTGALEIAGTVAHQRFPVPCGPNADDHGCCVVDIASRHLDPPAAQRQSAMAHARSARYRAHKIDSGLRGNWPFEVKGLLQLGYPVAVVPSFPDAGRRCVDGVVYVDDVPVLESPFGKDPLTAPLSSRPLEILQATGCADGDVVVWDAIDNSELRAAAERCHAEGRAMVGPSGAVGWYAAMVYPELFDPRSRGEELGYPVRRDGHLSVLPTVLVLCGSLNAMSREQIARLGVPAHALNHDLRLPPTANRNEITVVATPLPAGAISPGDAQRTARAAADFARSAFTDGTLIVIGGDTAAAVIGDETLEVLGLADTAIPIARFRGGTLLTKGGGIGRPDTLVRLLGDLR